MTAVMHGCCFIWLQVFPKRLRLTLGDSSWTVSHFFGINGTRQGAAFTHCDLVHIDGGHFDFTPWNDLAELARVSVSTTLLVVDDVPSIGDVARAMRIARAAGLVHEIACWGSIDRDNNTKGHHLRGFCLYAFSPAALHAFKSAEE